MKTMALTVTILAVAMLGLSMGMSHDDKHMKDDGMKSDGMHMKDDGMTHGDKMMDHGDMKMQGDGMKTEPGDMKMKDDMKGDGPMMDSDGMKMKDDGMKHDDMKMKDDGMMKHDDMGKGHTYTVPDDAELRRTLTPLQYDVTRKDATERPFRNAYWDNHDEGIYVEVITGEPLFSSTDKYESGTGWPSFTKPLEPANIVEKEDRSLFMTRTEVRSKHGDSHLGHVFDDGPAPTGLRYCMNSAALRFIPKEDLKKEGYEQYVGLFK